MSTKITSTDFASGEYVKFINRLAGPSITSFTYPGSASCLASSGGQTLIINGVYFSNPAVYINGSSVAVNSSTSTTITVTSPALAVGSYNVSVVNQTDSVPGMSAVQLLYSDSTPTWTTAAGSLGTAYEGTRVNTLLQASGDTSITFSVSAGTLPSGLSFVSTGPTGAYLTGTLGSVSSQTTYNFTIAATDAAGKVATQDFSFVVNPDTVTWSTTTLSIVLNVNSRVYTMLSATSAAGLDITYSSSNLPAGLSITGNTLSSGEQTSAVSYSFNITATASNGKSAQISVSMGVMVPSQAIYTTPGTYSWQAPTGVTRVSAVAFGGGGGGGAYSAYGRGGGGGGMSWVNDIIVVPGQSYTVVVGAGGTRGAYATTSLGGTGGQSYFINATTVQGGGGTGGAANSTTAAVGAGGGATWENVLYGTSGGAAGGVGGYGGVYGGGGGGCAGYGVQGGSGYQGSTSTTGQSGYFGGGGGGGGGGSGGSTYSGGGGGGTGLYGQGHNGHAGTGSTSNGQGGGGGSFYNGTGKGGNSTNAAAINSQGGLVGTGKTQYADGGYPGGGGGGTDNTTSPYYNGAGAAGGVRIIWGAGRAYPATNTKDQ
jgi:hypothetical protein